MRRAKISTSRLHCRIGMAAGVAKWNKIPGGTTDDPVEIGAIPSGNRPPRKRTAETSGMSVFHSKFTTILPVRYGIIYPRKCRFFHTAEMPVFRVSIFGEKYSDQCDFFNSYR